MFFLTPRYLKQARLLHKGVTRFLNYKRDLLPLAKVNEIDALKTELESAIKRRDRGQLDKLSVQINNTCEEALPEARVSEIAENVEVFFVAIVIALGIRSYIAQPFKIPTGSMQPTLNGYIAKPTETDESPILPVKWFQWLLQGRTYVNVISDHDGELRFSEPVTEHSYLGFLTHCKVHFQDGHVIKVPVPIRQLSGGDNSLALTSATMRETEEFTPDAQRVRVIQGGALIKKGDVLARGILDSGDQVLVNKFIYNFRAPKRGEVFVFTTKHINGINVPAEQGSQHYIKRLAGVPGDTLSVEAPKLLINGKVAEEFGFQRVMTGTYESPVNGYKGYGPAGMVGGTVNQIELGEEDYFAMGDNSYNSSDSRVWGKVPERNVVGPGMFCYLPFTKHWGPIK